MKRFISGIQLKRTTKQKHTHKKKHQFRITLPLAKFCLWEVNTNTTSNSLKVGLAMVNETTITILLSSYILTSRLVIPEKSQPSAVVHEWLVRRPSVRWGVPTGTLAGIWYSKCQHTMGASVFRPPVGEEQCVQSHVYSFSRDTN